MRAPAGALTFTDREHGRLPRLKDGAVVEKESGRPTNTTGQLRRVEAGMTVTQLAKLEPPAAR